MTDSGSGPSLPPPPGDYVADPASREGSPPAASGESAKIPAGWSQAPPGLTPDDGGPAPALPPLGSGFRPNDIFIGFGLSTAAFLFLFLIGLGIFAAIDEDPSENAEFVAIAIVVFIVDAVALVLVPFLLLRDRGAATLLGLRRPTVTALGWGLAALIASWVSLAIYTAIVDALDVEALDPVSAIDGDDAFTVLAAVLTGVAVVLMAPFAEEIFHRGFLVGAMARRWGTPVAVIISAAIFSALHFDVGSLIPFFIVGLIFAVAYLRSGNLWASISAHFVFNLVAFIVTLTDRGVS